MAVRYRLPFFILQQYLWFKLTKIILHHVIEILELILHIFNILLINRTRCVCTCSYLIQVCANAPESIQQMLQFLQIVFFDFSPNRYSADICTCPRSGSLCFFTNDCPLFI